MVLLHAVRAAIVQTGGNLTVAHFNHRLRGRSSDSDQRLVVKTADLLRVECVTGEPEVPHRPGAGSVEMWARQERHSFLSETARTVGARWIATAHHSDDQVELFFLRLFRGQASGLGGMAEMEPAPFDKELRLIRPLLAETKADLSRAAEEHGITYREDASNADITLRRNRVRHRLLPRLVKDFGPGAVTALRRCVEILREEEKLIAEMARTWLSEKAGTEPFDPLPTALQRQVMLRQMHGLGLVPEFERIEALRLHANRPVTVEKGMQVRRLADGRLEASRPQPVPAYVADRLGAKLEEPDGDLAFAGLAVSWEIRHVTVATLRRLKTARPGQERFDADAIGPAIELRHWKPGDRFQPIGLAKAAKLQDLFVSSKVPAAERRRRVVATTGRGEIFWVEGLRMSEKFKLVPGSNRYLNWRWQRPDALLATPGVA